MAQWDKKDDEKRVIHIQNPSDLTNASSQPEDQKVRLCYPRDVKAASPLLFHLVLFNSNLIRIWLWHRDKGTKEWKPFTVCERFKDVLFWGRLCTLRLKPLSLSRAVWPNQAVQKLQVIKNEKTSSNSHKSLLFYNCWTRMKKFLQSTWTSLKPLTCEVCLMHRPHGLRVYAFC